MKRYATAAALILMCGSAIAAQYSADQAKPLQEEAQRLNSKCRDGRGDDPQTDVFCDKRDAAYSKLESVGWCWDTLSGTGPEYKKTWIQCRSSPKALATPEQLDKANQQIKAATQDPQKVKLLECMGIKVYEDPQPAGHPPSKSECDAIKAGATEPAPPAAAPTAEATKNCRQQGTVLMSAFGAYKAGFEESQTVAALSEMQTTDRARTWVGRMVNIIYSNQMSGVTDSSEVFRQYQGQCLADKNISSLAVKLPRGSAGEQ